MPAPVNVPSGEANVDMAPAGMSGHETEATRPTTNTGVRPIVGVNLKGVPVPKQNQPVVRYAV